MRRFLYILLASLSLTFHVAAALDYTAQPGPFPIDHVDQSWHDAARNRDIPVRIYYPKSGTTNEHPIFPVILFSHGLGGSREGYEYLGEHWASCGYISVHLQHHGSDKEVARGLRPIKALRDAIALPANAINRPLDISFAIDHLTALNSDPAFFLHGQLDLARIGVAGHSFGAYTTMAVAGAQFPVLAGETHYADPRVKAAMAMSTPNAPDDNAAFDEVKIPVFHLTGTKDEMPQRRRGNDFDPVVGNTTAAERLRPYVHTQHAPAYLLVFEGGDHAVFSGRSAGSRPTDLSFQNLVLSGSTAFWDAWLKDNAEAHEWLENGGFSTAVGHFGTFEQKRPTSVAK